MRGYPSLRRDQTISRESQQRRDSRVRERRRPDRKAGVRSNAQIRKNPRTPFVLSLKRYKSRPARSRPEEPTPQENPRTVLPQGTARHRNQRSEDTEVTPGHQQRSRFFSDAQRLPLDNTTITPFGSEAENNRQLNRKVSSRKRSSQERKAGPEPMIAVTEREIY